MTPKDEKPTILSGFFDSFFSESVALRGAIPLIGFAPIYYSTSPIIRKDFSSDRDVSNFG
jgi:hypothetical protein